MTERYPMHILVLNGRPKGEYSITLLANPKVLAKMVNKMNEGMFMPYRKVLDGMDKE